MQQYMHSWKSWFADLPEATNSSSILSQGFPSCKSWGVISTVSMFLDGVTRALIFTPAFCVAAVFVTVRDLVICYAALYSVAGMLIVMMGLLHVCGTPLGPVESLAIAVIVGVCIDYLMHLAFAYRNSLMTHRYYKSRAAMLARTSSIVSAALTTLFSVAPLLASKLPPFRQFGFIFTMVTLVSVAFALGFFNALMMSICPLRTRLDAPDSHDTGAARGSAARDDANIQVQASVRCPSMPPCLCPSMPMSLTALTHGTHTCTRCAACLWLPSHTALTCVHVALSGAGRPRSSTSWTASSWSAFPSPRRCSCHPPRSSTQLGASGVTRRRPGTGTDGQTALEPLLLVSQPFSLLSFAE